MFETIFCAGNPLHSTLSRELLCLATPLLVGKLAHADRSLNKSLENSLADYNENNIGLYLR